ncbi:hypothetical protein D0T51_07445 [Parabacteroides sp. 52]|uniref:lipopolysaccharide kinase InaA family protein n=1 Tax=unclassified Parabacteroides TaxID=2649774 RepID=UPI0013D7DE71|nr:MULTISPECIES: lipopolysaccharide kinase InaA family protein [unclassified Parabacteroides]MDH6534843.1 tRNA A-37 threonylcarbamoyl transferase component Bud32 [Parabacteroides sp. PM5-20]NDV55561.1 hypothetical protein [Parabacteroides sp. 52]
MTKNTLFKGKTVIHPDFLEFETFIKSIPQRFPNEGECIYKGRNEIRVFKEKGVEFVVKSYKRPNIINRFIYDFIRSSKAERSYLYAIRIAEAGIGTPTPVAFINNQHGILFDDSYFISLKSVCPYSLKDLYQRSFDRHTEILQAIGRTTARFHQHGFLHTDYSPANIMFDDSKETIRVDIIDLNRMSFGKVSLKAGCKDFNRIPAQGDIQDILGGAYAQARGFDPAVCIQAIKRYREIESR